MSPEPSRAPVAVTGASGFVGRHLLQRLLDDGWPAVAVSRRGCGLAGLRDVRLASYDDGPALAHALRGVDAVVHLAALAHQDVGDADAVRRFHEANVGTTLRVADAAAAVGVRRFVLVSSIGVNGRRTDGRPFRDGDAPCPVEPYAVSKWEAEQRLASRLAGTPTEYVIVRPPLVYGPGCPGNFERLLGLVARAPLVPLGGLRAPRSFIGVKNLVDAILVAVRHPAVAGHTYLLADGRDISVAEVVTTFAEVLRPGRRVVVDLPVALLAAAARLAGRGAAWAKIADPLRVDATGFRAATGWTPPFDPAEGLRETARQFANAGSGRPVR